MCYEKIKHWVLLSLRGILIIAVYFLFLVYTPTMYGFTKSAFQEILSGYQSRILVFGPSVIKVKVADTVQKRLKGLSDTKELNDGTGMFFIFEDADTHGIWMKDMNFSIDIIWFDRFGSIVHIEESVSPDTYPTVFEPEKDASFVLEVPAGFVGRSNIKLGDTIDLY